MKPRDEHNDDPARDQADPVGPVGPVDPIDRAANDLDGLFAAIYDELRGLAAARLASERPDHTLQPTALVHETFLRLLDQDRTRWNDRRHLMAIAAMAMRRVLVDHARRHGRVRDGGKGRREDGVAPRTARRRVELDDAVAELEAGSAVDLVALDAALDHIGAENPRWLRIVELRFFAGLSVDETAEILELAPRTAELDWRAARACLRKLMEGGAGSTPPAAS